MGITVWLCALLLSFFGGVAHAGEPVCETDGGEVVSSMGLSFGSFEEKGFKIVAVDDIHPGALPTDLAPPRLLEIVRPGLQAITIGRILSSCGCLTITAPQRTFMAGERAFLELRNIKPTPKDGATYAFFVQLAAPADMTLRFDIFVKSEKTPPKPPEKTAEQTGEKAPDKK